MLPLISVVLVILGALGIRNLLPGNRKRRRQVRFIRETLAATRTFDNRAYHRVSIDGTRPDQQFDPDDSIPSKANAPAG